MELKIELLKNYLEEFPIFHKLLSDQISFINEKYKDKNLSINLINDKELKILFLFFSTLKNNMIANINENNKKLEEDFNITMNFAGKFVKDFKYNLLYLWHHFLIISLIVEIKSFLIKRNDSIRTSTANINKIMYLFDKNNDIVTILYKNNKININQIFSFLNIYIIWIQENNNNNKINNEFPYDKYNNLKKSFLLKIFFNLLKMIFQIELNLKKNVNKLNDLFEHLNHLYSLIDESNINNIVILNNESFSITSILNNLNFDLYLKNKNNLLKFYKIFIKNNFAQSKIIEEIIYNIKQAFLNLSIIDKNKNSNKKIENDLLIQNFYYDLLQSLFDEFTSNLDSIRVFIYNGIDSKMSFKLGKERIINSIIFFSFCLKVEAFDLINDKHIYPLFTLYDESKNINIFKLYIKQKFKRNKYVLYINEQGKNKDILIDELPFIENNKEYFIALNIEKSSIYIYLDKNSKEIKIKPLSNENIVFQIGYDKISLEYFKGLLGPFITLKNPGISKKTTKFITKVLYLREKYPYIVYSLCNSTIYKFDYMNNFKYSHNLEKDQIAMKNSNIINDINELNNKLECLIFLTPSIIEFYYDMKESPFDKYYLPLVPNLCENQKYYIIDELNISLFKKENISLNFLINNGLYVICLQYEYFYQLLIRLFDNYTLDYNNQNNFFISKEIQELINNILDNTIKILIKFSNNILIFYGAFKTVFLNLFNFIKYFNHFNKNNISDSVIKNLGNLIFGIFDDINDKKENNYKYNLDDNDIKKLIIFGNGLIDFLLTSELYNNSNKEIIVYIFSLLFSINKKVINTLFITNKDILWKILSFTELLENQLSDEKISEEKNKKIYIKIFNLLKEYFLSIKAEESRQIFFSDMIHYFMSKNKDKHYLIYNYFNLIYELISNEYYIENKEIQIIIDYIFELIKNLNYNLNINIEINNIDNKNENAYKNNSISDTFEIKQKIICIVFRIFVNLIFINEYDKETTKNLLKLIKCLYFTKEILEVICQEIDKLFFFLFYIKNPNRVNNFNLYINKKKELNISKIYSHIFKFLFVILYSLINNRNNNMKEENDPTKSKLTNEVLSLFISLNKKIGEEFQNDRKNEITYLCLLNYIKFLYRIVFTEDVFNKFSLIEIDMFIFNLSDLIYLSNNENLLFTNTLFKIKENKKSFKKTIIEIILDIYIKILFNHKLQKSHKLIYISLNSIFDNVKIGNNNFTICYYNDYLNNLLNKKKKSKEEQIIIDKITKINEILSKESNNKFEVSFITFFLLKLSAYFENKILKKDNSLKNYLEKYIKKLLQEHKDLYKLNKNIFTKTSKNFYYNHLKDKIESYVISNKSKKKENLEIPPEIKIFFQQKLSKFNSHISEEFTSGNCNIKKNIEKRNKSLIIDENDPNKGLQFGKKMSSSLAYVNKSPVLSNRNESLKFSPKLYKNLNYFKSNSPTNAASSVKRKILYIEDNIIDKNEDDFENDLQLNEKPDEDKNEINENININIESNTIINIDMDLPNNHLSNLKKINLSEYVNSIFYFENIDINYITNFKKYLMNNIFSLFFLDVFYNNELFKKMKTFYLNEYETSKHDTKMLNYPSKYKNYNNGLEPGMFLKMHNNFFNNKFFSISHPYFVEYIKKNNIINKSIKIIPKKLPEYLNYKNKSISLNIYCELIKIDHSYFGQIIGFNFENQGKFLIFKEDDIDLNIENDKIFENINNYKYLFSLTCLINSEKEIQENKNNIKENKRKKNKKKFVIILFSEIEEIIERRFLFMWQGFEIYLKNGKSYFFNLFSENMKNNLFDYFKKEERLKNLIRSRDFLYKEKEITRKWAKYYLQNYEYLLLVNKYGSRTFNDNNQYPVFPWLLINNYENIEKINGINVTENLIEKFFNNKEENANIDEKTKDLLKSLRKMKYPICIQTEEKIKKVIEKYIEEDEKFKYHLGIHYSTSYYIYYYLMRQEPYSDLLILLQNYQQENPNRMFIGINESISLLERSKDPREVIPELFTRFEYLINLNCNFFGYRNNNSIVDDNLIVHFNNNKENNPLYQYINFIIEHRKLLDSKLISININDWIDNIFGINQLPQNKKNRENCCNIFLKTSYEQEINLLKKLEKYIEKIKNNKENKKKLLKKLLTKITSILDFGQTPYQIFKEKHRKRKINILNVVENKGEIEEKENDDDLDNYTIDDFEKVEKILNPKNLNYEIKSKYNFVYFEINPILNKIFW